MLCENVYALLDRTGVTANWSVCGENGEILEVIAGCCFCLTIDITGRNGLFFVTKVTKKGGKPMQAYCVKCRAKREMKDAKAITMKNGKPATQGVCPTCGTKMFRIGKG